MSLHQTVADRLLAAGLDPVDTERAVRTALDEDFRYGPDLTSAATSPPGASAVAGVVARQPGVLAGLPVALAVLDAAGVPPPPSPPSTPSGPSRCSATATGSTAAPRFCGSPGRCGRCSAPSGPC